MGDISVPTVLVGLIASWILIVIEKRMDSTNEKKELKFRICNMADKMMRLGISVEQNSLMFSMYDREMDIYNDENKKDLKFYHLSKSNDYAVEYNNLKSDFMGGISRLRIYGFTANIDAVFNVALEVHEMKLRNFHNPFSLATNPVDLNKIFKEQYELVEDTMNSDRCTKLTQIQILLQPNYFNVNDIK